MNTNDHKAKERIIGLFLIFLICLFFLTWVEASPRWFGPTTYSIQDCEPETAAALAEVAEEISRYSVPLSPSPIGDIRVFCSTNNTVTQNQGARGSTEATWKVSNLELVSADVWVNANMQGRDIYRTLRHELAHAVGIMHSDSQWSLMHPYPLIDYFDTETLRALIDRYGHSYSVTTKYGDRYTPCILFLGQWWWSVEHFTGDGWRAVQYGEADC